MIKLKFLGQPIFDMHSGSRDKTHLILHEKNHNRVGTIL